MKLLRRILILLLALPGVCVAELTDENLLQQLPKGYKIDFQTRKGNVILTEMVPQAETVRSWSEMVTTQIFLGLKAATLEQFQALMVKNWLAVCKGGESASVARGEENGYGIFIWLQKCPLNRSTGRPEITWFKAIKGNDSFYLVQKAFRFEPTNEQIAQWMQYFRTIKVCDTRLADRPCPKLEETAR